MAQFNFEIPPIDTSPSATSPEASGPAKKTDRKIHALLQQRQLLSAHVKEITAPSATISSASFTPGSSSQLTQEERKKLVEQSLQTIKVKGSLSTKASEQGFWAAQHPVNLVYPSTESIASAPPPLPAPPPPPSSSQDSFLEFRTSLSMAPPLSHEAATAEASAANIPSAQRIVTEADILRIEEAQQRLTSAEASRADLTTCVQLKEALAQVYLDAGQFLEAFRIRNEIAHTVFPDSHPLTDMAGTIERTSSLSPLPRMGGHIENLDTGSIKNHTIHCSRRMLARNAADPNPQDCFCFDFYLTHVARNELTKNVAAIQDHTLSIGQQIGHNVTITSSRFHIIRKYDEGSNRYITEGGLPIQNDDITGSPNDHLTITIEDIGKILIHTTPNQYSLYNQVEIQLNASESQGPEGLRKLQTILSIVGLGPALCPSRSDDENRLKLFTVLHAFHPAVAYEIERDKQYYQLSMTELQQTIIRNHPECSAVLKKYLASPRLLEKQELFPGRHTYMIKDMGEQIRASSCGLLVGIKSRATTDLNWDRHPDVAREGFTKIADGFVRRIKQGVAVMSNLESIQRQGDVESGSSPDMDIQKGSFDTAFTRLVPTSLLDPTPSGERSTSLHRISFCADGIRLLVDADCMGLAGTYAHYTDRYGSRLIREYKNRSGLPQHSIELASMVAPRTKDLVNINEVMIKDVLPSRFMRKIIVKRPEMKEILIESMRRHGLIKKKIKGFKKVEYLVTPGYETPLQDFIVVGNSMSQGMWS